MARATRQSGATAKTNATKFIEGLPKQEKGTMIFLLLILALIFGASACAFLAQCNTLLHVAAL
jgi:hypothetical protein